MHKQTHTWRLNHCRISCGWLSLRAKFILFVILLSLPLPLSFPFFSISFFRPRSPSFLSFFFFFLLFFLSFCFLLILYPFILSFLLFVPLSLSPSLLSFFLSPFLLSLILFLYFPSLFLPLLCLFFLHLSPFSSICLPLLLFSLPLFLFIFLSTLIKGRLRLIWGHRKFMGWIRQELSKYYLGRLLPHHTHA